MRVNTIIVETMRPAFEQPRLRPSELGQGTVADKFAKCRRHSFDWPEMSRMWILCRDFQFKLQDLVIQLIGFLRRLSQSPSPLAIARQGALTLQWPVVSWLVWVNRVNTKQSKSWLNIPINMNEISMECCMGCPILTTSFGWSAGRSLKDFVDLKLRHAHCIAQLVQMLQILPGTQRDTAWLSLEMGARKSL